MFGLVPHGNWTCVEFEGVLYHVTSRGNRRENIYDDDLGRLEFREILGKVVEICNWICHAHCQMGITTFR